MSIFATPLPVPPVDVQSSESLLFTEEDQIAPANSAENARLEERIVEQRAKFCKARPWWDCTEQLTQGACAFSDGRCHGAPLASQQQSYFAKWLRLHSAIYAGMPQPDVGRASFGAAPSGSSRRTASVRRRPAVVSQQRGA